MKYFMEYIGAENEYWPLLFDRYDLKRNVRTLPINGLNESAAHLVLFAPKSLMSYETNVFTVWLKNGGKIYNDLDNTEYSTAECKTVAELVLLEKAGEIIVPEIFPRYKDDNESNFFILKRTTDRMLKSSAGSHENYAIEEKLFKRLTLYDEKKKERTDEQNIMLSHLVSRIIYTGAGHIQTDKNYTKIKFILSPRASFTHKLFSGDSRAFRPLIHQKNQVLVQPSLSFLSRLHLICGDLNRSDWSLYLKYGTTALILDFLEIAPKEDVRKLAEKIFLELPLDLLRTLSVSISDSENFFKVQFEKAQKIQSEIIKYVLKFRDELKAKNRELEQIIDLWQKAIAPTPEMDDRLDWRIKKKLIEFKTGEKISYLSSLRDKNTMKIISKLDLSYHRIDAKDLYKKLVDSGFAKSLYPISKISEKLTKPPKGRAEKRTRLVEYSLKSGLAGNIILDWSEMHLQKTKVSLPTIVYFDEEDENLLKRIIDRFLMFLPKNT